MGMGFEVRLREAEAAINELIRICQQTGGSVYIGTRDGSGFSAKLKESITIAYWIPMEEKHE